MQRTLIAFITVSAMLPLMADEKPFTRTHGESFTVIGFEARTTNAQEMSPNGIIPKLWKHVGEGKLDAVPERANENIVALYTDYESDKDGPYTFVLGVRVNHPRNVPTGMVARHVPAGEYARFVSAKNPAPDAVIGLWNQIWGLEKAHSITRAYRTDYEVHCMQAGRETAAELFVGLKK